MFQATRQPSNSPLLTHHERLSFSEPGYHYVLSRQPNETNFLVTDATQTISAPVGWAFGSGEVAQTYVVKHDNQYLESRLTYYTSLMALGITTGHSATTPGNIEEALGDPIDADVLPRCFGCHTTGSTTSGKFDPDHATLGLTCEACHGPGEKHVTAMDNGLSEPAEGTIFSAKNLSPMDSVDFCGACHRTSADVAMLPSINRGITNLRFQPYRLQRSLCWGEKGDPRITCVACHNPHQPLVRNLAAYDDKCLKCHANTGESPSSTQVAGCTVGKSGCASCHMPKYEIPAVHAMFTDHYIRIVRPGSGFQP
ncbi:cytochrome c3 family protein [Edaphobacter paludis]|uniref:Cytochrome c3 family protein n=1 Tax=Edaphobacter paludis TaxID=3035702 RepID=A0AAU7CWC5_9BACT